MILQRCYTVCLVLHRLFRCNKVLSVGDLEKFEKGCFRLLKRFVDTGLQKIFERGVTFASHSQVCQNGDF